MDGIIIGVDESAAAAHALRWGAAHAKCRGRPATAVMAWTYRDQHQLDPDAVFDVSYSHREARRDLDAIIERAFDGANPGLHRRAVCDGPAAALIGASHGADLVVVGARGMGGFKGLLLGSVSREVLYGSTAPVAVVRGAAAQPDGPVVVGVDGSPTARRALRWAAAEATAQHRKLVVVHTWHVSAIGEGYMFAHVEADSAAAAAQCLLEREVALCEPSAVPIERRVEVGFPAGVLVDASRRASLVVVGSRGQRAAAGLLLGSVSDQLAHHAECPVVVVPPGAADEASRRRP